MMEEGRRPEPVAKLTNYLVVSAWCSRCRSPIRVPFSDLAKSQHLSCESCGLSWEFDLDADALSSIDQNFRRLEDPIRDSEAWVEVRGYP